MILSFNHLSKFSLQTKKSKHFSAQKLNYHEPFISHNNLLSGILSMVKTRQSAKEEEKEDIENSKNIFSNRQTRSQSKCKT